MKSSTIFFSIAAVFLTVQSRAEIPQTIHHQGRIAVNGTNFDGTGEFRFLIYQTFSNGTISGVNWNNETSTPSNLDAPSTAVSATVTKGLYSVRLGESPQAPLPDILQPPFNGNIWLRIWFDDGVNGMQQLAPDRILSAVPFAKQAARAASVNDGSITEISLHPSISIPKLRSGVAQTAVDPPWIGPLLPFSATFSSPFLSSPVVTTTPSANAQARLTQVSTTGFSGTVSLPPVEDWSSVVDASFAYADTSSAIIDGRPAVALVTPAEVKFAINSSSDGTGTWTVSTVSAENSRRCSLALIAGRPAIAYTTPGTNGVLKFAINSAADGSGTWTVNTVDPALDSQIHHRALALIDNRPAIAYHNASTGGDLKFAINFDSDGLGAWKLSTVDSGLSGDGAALAVVDGRAAIAYEDRQPTISLKFAINANAQANGTWSNSTINTLASGSYVSPSLGIRGGKPVVSFGSLSTIDRQFFLENSASDGSGIWTGVGFATSIVSRRSSMAVVSGVPVISYLDENDKLSVAVHPDGTSSGEWETASLNTGAIYPSIISLGNRPAFTYSNQANRPVFWFPQPVDIHWIAVEP